MFFSLCKHPDPRFPNQSTIGSWIFNHDNGWYQPEENTWFKGYYHDLIDHGNFLKFVEIDGKISFVHDNERSCPLWWDEKHKILTNLPGVGTRLWADDSITISDCDISTTKNNNLYDIDLSPIALDDCVDQIAQNLLSKFLCFRNDYFYTSKKFFPTGGVDTSTLWSIIDYLDIDCEIVNYQHFEYDYFTNINLLDIQKNHWGYTQLHHWRDPCVLITGSCGDEFLFRGPYTIGLWTSWHDVDIESLIRGSSAYHSKYFLLEKNLNIFRKFYDQKESIKEQCPTKLDLLKQIININLNDHQHWHLGNTLTWTPFKDINFTKLLLRLDVEDLIKQILDAHINKRLIEQFSPRISKFVSEYKNHNSRQKLICLNNT